MCFPERFTPLEIPAGHYPPGIIIKPDSPAAAGPEGLPPGHEPFSPSWRTLRAGSRGGAWPGGRSEALFLTG